jgi:hypothetical protein
LDKAAAGLIDQGFHVDYKLKPVYQHAERIIKTDEMAELGMRDMIPRYVDSDHVELGGLDAKRLKALGAEIMAEAMCD